jgi:transcription antitermination factor NusG
MTTFGETTPWVVVLTFAQAEWQAYTNLLRHGVEAFLPYTVGTVRRGRWQQGIIRPQFPGYLFAALAERVNTETIKRATGVRDLLKLGGGGLVYVRPEEVASCKRQWVKAYRESMPHPRRKLVLNPGDWVEIPLGPLAGTPVCVDRVDKSGIVWASLGKLQVTFHLDDAVHKSVRVRAKPARTPKHRKHKPL